MPQLYARVFLQILDSSLAEDYQTRHVFEDLLKLTNQDGVVDMTRQAIARRTNVPLDIINAAIEKLEAADPHSRDQEHEGRRILRLDEHRDWGWRILNFQKYEAIRVTTDMREWNAVRMANYRSKKKSPPAPPKEKEELTPEGTSPSERSPTCSLPVVLQPEERERPVEFPIGFPETVEKALAESATTCIPEDFVKADWYDCAGRNGHDRYDKPITRWALHIQGAWLKQRNYEEQRKQGGSASGPTRQFKREPFISEMRAQVDSLESLITHSIANKDALEYNRESPKFEAEKEKLRGYRTTLNQVREKIAQSAYDNP